jgi:hypothetical protein
MSKPVVRAFKHQPLYRGLAHLRQRLAAEGGECFKKPYDTRAEAEQFARSRERRHGRQRAYICWCGYWHLTSQ